MNSKTINERIAAYDGQDSPFDAFGGKPIPYVGWFWRIVDFDAETQWFGVIPVDAESNGKNLVGFMQANKWSYPEIEASKEQWTEIKRRIIAAIESPLTDNFKHANDAIQSLAEDKEFHSYKVWY